MAIKFNDKMTTIKVKIGSGEVFIREEKLRGYVSKNGIWAIHRPYQKSQKRNGYCLTHIASGFNCNKGGWFKTRDEAIKAASKLNAIADWKTCVKYKKGIPVLPKKLLKEGGAILRPFFKKAA